MSKGWSVVEGESGEVRFEATVQVPTDQGLGVSVGRVAAQWELKAGGKTLGAGDGAPPTPAWFKLPPEAVAGGSVSLSLVTKRSGGDGGIARIQGGPYRIGRYSLIKERTRRLMARNISKNLSILLLIGALFALGRSWAGGRSSACTGPWVRWRLRSRPMQPWFMGGAPSCPSRWATSGGLAWSRRWPSALPTLCYPPSIGSWSHHNGPPILVGVSVLIAASAFDAIVEPDLPAAYAGLLAFVLSIAVALGRHFRRTLVELDVRNAQLQRFNEAANRFVPSQLLNLIGRKSVVDVVRGDQRQMELTVMFSDVRGFTTLAEARTPAETMDLTTGI